MFDCLLFTSDPLYGSNNEMRAWWFGVTQPMIDFFVIFFFRTNEKTRVLSRWHWSWYSRMCSISRRSHWSLHSFFQSWKTSWWWHHHHDPWEWSMRKRLSNCWEWMIYFCAPGKNIKARLCVVPTFIPTISMKYEVRWKNPGSRVSPTLAELLRSMFSISEKLCVDKKNNVKNVVCHSF